MEIYILNNTYDRIGVVENFESFIWTERFTSYGDFEMTVPPSPIADIATIGRYVSQSNTFSIMRIESREIRDDEQGRTMVYLKGRCMKSILDDRVVHPSGSNTDRWVRSGTMGQVVKALVDQVCLHGTGFSEKDIIPGLYTADITTDTEHVRVSVGLESLYEAVKKLCESADLGFDIQLNNTHPRLRFVVYNGVNRPNTIFGPILDNLSNQTSLRDETNYKNIAYVRSKDGATTREVAAKGHSILREGFARRTILVEANDVVDADLTYQEIAETLTQKGREALLEHKRVRLYDGEVVIDSNFRYGAAYRLGDTVQLMDVDHNKYTTTVIEYIWAHDAEGYRGYPTFSDVSVD